MQVHTQDLGPGGDQVPLGFCGTKAFKETLESLLTAQGQEEELESHSGIEGRKDRNIHSVFYLAPNSFELGNSPYYCPSFSQEIFRQPFRQLCYQETPGPLEALS